MNRLRLLGPAAIACCLLTPAISGAQSRSAAASDNQPGLLEPRGMARQTDPAATATAVKRADQQTVATSAILIRNPKTSSGEPPFALADQFGRVQRYVEPTTGLNLDRFVGQIVTVEHDTGRTLLASQLRFGDERLARLDQQRPPNPATPGGISFAVPQAPDFASTPVVITQFEDPSGAAATSEPIPEPIVLEEVVGDSIVRPVEGLALPGTSTPSTGPVVSPIDTIAAATGQQSKCLTPNCGCCDTASPDLFFEAELLLLRLFNSQPSVTNDNYETGSRFTLGAKTQDGAHWLARYLEYENENYDGANDLSFEFYNLEYGRTFNLGCRWTGLFTIGGQLTEFQDTSGMVDYGDAIGPTVGAQLRGPRWGSFHPLLGARHSLQFGETSAFGATSFGSFTTTELAAGIEYQQRTRNGSVFGRASIESVLIDGAAFSGNNFTPFGFGLSLGVTR